MTITNEMLRLVITTGIATAILFVETAFSADPIFVDAEAVGFDSVPYTYTPSPFKVKQAKKLGQTLEVNIESSVSLTGYLVKSAGEEPRPAIVLLHSCFGISRAEEMWSDRLVSWGYVVLSVDSFKPRGFDNICDGRVGGGGETTPWRRALDAYGAKQYLSTLSFVDADRVAVMGMSHGGWTVLEIIKRSTSERLALKPFQAAIAFYPLCSEPEPINTPILILTGDKDQWTPAVICEQYLDKLQPQHEISMKVFAGAYHGFDIVGIDTIDTGYIVRYNQKAADEAFRMSRRFLEERL
jgi:dienelactone hydrolase